MKLSIASDATSGLEDKLPTALCSAFREVVWPQFMTHLHQELSRLNLQCGHFGPRQTEFQSQQFKLSEIHEGIEVIKLEVSDFHVTQQRIESWLRRETQKPRQAELVDKDDQPLSSAKTSSNALVAVGSQRMQGEWKRGSLGEL